VTGSTMQLIYSAIAANTIAKVNATYITI